MNRRIIGISGAARSGKNTFAKYLAEALRPTFTVKQVQISEPLKRYVRELFGWTEEHTDGYLKDIPDTRYPQIGGHVWTRIDRDRFEYVCGACGHQKPVSREAENNPGECVTYLTPRKAMQTLGSEWPVSMGQPSIYAKTAVRKCLNIMDVGRWDVPVITDVRFFHDVQAIVNAGGIVVHMVRNGDGLGGAAALHAGEVARVSKEFQSQVSYTINNNGSLDDLMEEAVKFVVHLETEHIRLSLEESEG